MKRNEGKYHVLLSTDETLQVKIGVALIKKWFQVTLKI